MKEDFVRLDGHGIRAIARRADILVETSCRVHQPPPAPARRLPRQEALEIWISGRLSRYYLSGASEILKTGRGILKKSWDLRTHPVIMPVGTSAVEIRNCSITRMPIIDSYSRFSLIEVSL